MATKPSRPTEGIEVPDTVSLASENTPQIKLAEIEVRAVQVQPPTKKKPKREPRDEAADADQIQFSYPNRHGTGYVSRPA